MRAVVIIQARMGSTRLPGKVLRPIVGHPMLWHIVQRVRQTRGLTEVVVATSDQPSDEPLRAFCRSADIPCFAGSENDVLDRFYRAAKQHDGDPLIRITGDCPFVDPELVGSLIGLYMTARYDHVAVATGAGALYLKGGRFPDGLDAECFSFRALERAWNDAKDPLDREHVTPYIWRNKDKFRCSHLFGEHDLSALRWTVDNEADFEVVRQVYEALYREGKAFLMEDILRYFVAHPELAATNQSFIGKEGYSEIWKVKS